MRDESTPGAAARTIGTRIAMEGVLDRVREPLPTRVKDTPELPAAYDDALRAGLDALGLTLDPAARAAIDGHVRLLLAWTAAINLTAIRDPVTVATAHVLDSLAAVDLLRGLGVDRFLDLGSGGGLPGIPIAAALPAGAALLVEATGKKARFLDIVLEATGLSPRVAVANARAEALARGADREGWPVVTARAVASTADLVELAFPLLVDGGRLVAWKRGDLASELDEARRTAGALGGGTIDVIDVAVPALAGHRLVVATRRGRVPDAYPREPSARARRPR